MFVFKVAPHESQSLILDAVSVPRMVPYVLLRQRLLQLSDDLGTIRREHLTYNDGDGVSES